MPLDQVDIEKQDKNMTFLEHVEELRWHILRSLLAIFIGSVVAFIYGKWLFNNVIFGPIDTNFPLYRWLCELGNMIYSDDRLCVEEFKFTTQNLTLSGQLMYHIVTALVFGFIASFPYLLWELWRFIKPALKPRERRYTTGFVLVTSMLFTIGILFGYYILTPLSINFLANYEVSEQISNQFTLKSYVSFVTTLTLASGLIFELPLLIYILARLGVVSGTFLKKYRKHAIIIILILASVITPPDIMSQVLLSIPIYFLYEIGIIIAHRIERRHDREFDKSNS